MNRHSDKIQVCLPVYNGSQFIRDTLETLLNQSYSDLEILVLDDASTDDTYEILQEFAAHDARLTLHRNDQNRGILFSRNRLFELADARYVALADADDLFESHRLEEQLAYLKKHDLGMVSCAYSAFGEREFDFYPPEKHDDIHAYMLLYNVILNPGVMLDRAKVALTNVLVDSRYRGAADYDSWLRLLNKTRVGCVPKKLVRYRIHKEQESSDNFLRQQNAHLRILSREYQALGLAYSQDALKVLIWPHLYADSLSIDQLKEVGIYVKTLFSDMDRIQLPMKSALSFAIDIRYKGISRRYAAKGLFFYVRYAGLKRLFSGRNMGFSFVYDCLFRK
ncbi:glycosyltransferase family 2 protein [Amphritea sp.]|uniref:glycosyltransferase family 2 protein n=1 Tax=Amphritea sp. TaxID=1872502 RepID=UPI003A954F04